MRRVLARITFTVLLATASVAILAGAALAVPGNDAFSAATNVAAPPFSETLDTSGATTEPGEPAPSCLPAGFVSGASVWYTHTTPTAVKMSVSTAGSKYDTVLAVYTGTTLGDLSEKACADDTDEGSLQARVSLRTTAATTYFIQVSGFAGASGLLRFSLDVVDQLPNDDFAGALEVASLPFTLTQSNVTATAEAGEPEFCQIPDRTLWFKFAPATTTNVHAVTTSADFEPGVHVWRGTTLSNLEFIDCFGLPSDGIFTAEAGETYYLTVDTIFGETGEYEISLDAIPAPGNDDFADATEITAVPFVTAGTNLGATMEAGEPSPACSEGSRSVWYTFTATDAVPLVASTQGSDFDTVVAVYAGTELDSLDERGCNDDSGTGLQSRVGFLAQPGTTYFIQVSGFFGESGSIQFHLENGFVLNLPTGPLGAGDDGERLDAHALAVDPATGLAGAGAEAQYGPGSGGHVSACAGVFIVGECVEQDLP